MTDVDRDSICRCGHVRWKHRVNDDVAECEGTTRNDCPCERFEAVRLCGGATTRAAEEQNYLLAMRGRL